jgi:DNA polymerase I-like protein with 3'-5' exonuclease and polymerase domains
MRLIDEVAHLGAGTVIAIDTETTGLRPFNGDVLRGVSVAFRRGDGTLVSEYWPLSHPNSVNVSAAAVARAINQAHRHAELCVYHNGKFDAKFLAQIGVEWPARFYDTKVVSFLLDENENHSLKPTAARLWPDEDAAGEQRHVKELMASETKGACYKRLRPPSWSRASRSRRRTPGPGSRTSASSARPGRR